MDDDFQFNCLCHKHKNTVDADGKPFAERYEMMATAVHILKWKDILNKGKSHIVQIV